MLNAEFKPAVRQSLSDRPVGKIVNCKSKIQKMSFQTTPISGLLVFQPRIFADDRGYFYESWNQQTWLDAGVTADFVQDNQARSTFGVLRGLHYQSGEAAQAKLVRVIEGEVLDVAVDLRPGSPTWCSNVSSRRGPASSAAAAPNWI